MKKIINADKERVKIEWDGNCLGDDDEKVTVQQLKTSKWNPKRPGEGAWMQYLTK